MKLNIDNTFIENLPSDSNLNNTTRQVYNACFSFVEPKKASTPKLLHVSKNLASAIGFSKIDIQSEEFIKLMSGNIVYPNTKPYAMNYGGHQFGSWAGQLGDGRAINLFEVFNKNKRYILQLKGAGKTPYSRQGDGLAVLRSSIREYLCSEAMHHLGIPTTRALSLVLTGDQVLRDIMYNGNAEYERGAIVCRVAPSFIRFGSFEIFAARQEYDNLKLLLDYTINQFFSELGKPSKKTYMSFFREVTKRTLEMIIHWQRVGFVHGVMNTDNMSILGLTIDYGPYGWLEDFNFGWTPNTTDNQHKRYRFGNQPNIALWNLYQLANALYPLIEEAKPFETVLNEFKSNFEKKSLQMMRSKLGLKTEKDEDNLLIEKLEDNLQLTETDMTIFFRKLADFNMENPEKGIDIIHQAYYKPAEVKGEIKKEWNTWFEKYAERLNSEQLTHKERKQEMNKVNPKYVLRNYMAQLAIDDAEKGNYNLLNELFILLKKPYNEQSEYQKWFAKRPEWARHKIGCSMLSCSS